MSRHCFLHAWAHHGFISCRELSRPRCCILEHDPEKWVYRFSEKIMLRQLEHDPEKWVPVFGKDHAPPKVSPMPPDRASRAEVSPRRGDRSRTGRRRAAAKSQFDVPVVATRTGSGR